MTNPNDPQWHRPGTRVAKPDPEKPKSKRDYIAEAAAALGPNAKLAMASGEANPLLAAVILAQALDRLGMHLETAAAISSYTRSK